jgi:hypothetical protein
MDIAAVVAWFQLHWADITGFVAYVIAGASIIVKLTPTLKDDDVLKGVIKFLGKYIALNR